LPGVHPFDSCASLWSLESHHCLLFPWDVPGLQNPGMKLTQAHGH
jgi:hypothetical protein